MLEEHALHDLQATDDVRTPEPIHLEERATAGVVQANDATETDTQLGRNASPRANDHPLPCTETLRLRLPRKERMSRSL